MTTPTVHENIWDALADFKRRAPVIRKTQHVEAGKVNYNFAGLPEIDEQIGGLFDELGFVWSCIPDLEMEGGQRQFVLRTTLYHRPSGQSREGTYPLKGESVQQHGGAITYARRYALVAVLNLVVAEDDDDGLKAEMAASQSPAAQVRGAQRRSAQRGAPRNSRPVVPPEPTEGGAPGTEPKPVLADPQAPASKATRNKVFALVKELGYEDRAEYLGYVNRVLASHDSGPVSSTNDLTQEQAGWVIERAEAAEAGPPVEPGPPAESEG